jgi:opacity protein-like surface antigen
MFPRSLMIMLLASASVAVRAFAQSDEAERQDAAVQAFGSFVATTTQNDINNTGTNSGSLTPETSRAPARKSAQPFVYGAGADINLARRVFMRGEYHGFFYNSPTYDLPAFTGLVRVTHQAETSIGFGYRF